MFKLVSLLLVPTIAMSLTQDVKSNQLVKIEQAPCKYDIVKEFSVESVKKNDTYATNNDKMAENDSVKTLEEAPKKWFFREKKPFAQINISIQNQKMPNDTASLVSGEEYDDRVDVFSWLNDKFAYMYELKDRIDECEKESAKLWTEYYALKDVYDRALARYSEKWAEDNGISFVPRRVHMR